MCMEDLTATQRAVPERQGQAACPKAIPMSCKGCLLHCPEQEGQMTLTEEERDLLLQMFLHRKRWLQDQRERKLVSKRLLAGKAARLKAIDERLAATEVLQAKLQLGKYEEE